MIPTGLTGRRPIAGAAEASDRRPRLGDVLGARRIAGREALFEALVDERFLTIFGGPFVSGELVMRLLGQGLGRASMGTLAVVEGGLDFLAVDAGARDSRLAEILLFGPIAHHSRMKIALFGASHVVMLVWVASITPGQTDCSALRLLLRAGLGWGTMPEPWRTRIFAADEGMRKPSSG